jgi:hypothetical protein
MLGINRHLFLVQMRIALKPRFLISRRTADNNTVIRVQAHTDTRVIEEHLIDLFEGSA